MTEVLTNEVMESHHDAAIVLPLPPAPSLGLLEDAAMQILDYLNWLTFAWDDELSPEGLREKMEIATARLLAIAQALPAAHAAARQMIAENPWFFGLIPSVEPERGFGSREPGG
jgi:hypothetical protein